jgi:hypothetical protein
VDEMASAGTARVVILRVSHLLDHRRGRARVCILVHHCQLIGWVIWTFGDRRPGRDREETHAEAPGKKIGFDTGSSTGASTHPRHATPNTPDPNGPPAPGAFTQRDRRRAALEIGRNHSSPWHWTHPARLARVGDLRQHRAPVRGSTTGLPKGGGPRWEPAGLPGR